MANTRGTAYYWKQAHHCAVVEPKRQQLGSINNLLNKRVAPETGVTKNCSSRVRADTDFVPFDYTPDQSMLQKGRTIPVLD